MIIDSSKKPIAYFDKTGIHFSSNNTAFGEMGVQTVDGNKFIAFSVDGKYGQAINNGMAWGIKTTTDNKFHPIFYIKNFEMGALNSDTSYGELVLSACNLILGGIETGIISGNVKLYGDVLNGMFFEDANTGKVLFDIIPEFSGSNYDTINILGNISFYANASGSNSLKIGNGSNYCLLSDDGYVSCNHLYISHGEGYPLYVDGDGKFTGYIEAKDFQKSSLAEKKKNIKLFNKNALELVKNTNIYEYNYKTEPNKTKKDIGAVIGEDYKCPSEILSNDNKSVNLASMLGVAYKAIQEQQEEIEELKKEIEKLKGGK